MLSSHLSYDRAKPTIFRGKAEPNKDLTRIRLQEITAVARTLAIGLNRKRRNAFCSNKSASTVNLSSFDFDLSEEYFSQIQTHSERRWQEFFKSQRSYEELDVNTERKFGRKIVLQNPQFELTKKSDRYIVTTKGLNPELSLSLFNIDTDVNLTSLEIQELKLGNIHSSDIYDVLIKVKPNSKIRASAERDFTASTIIKYTKTSSRTEILKPLFKQYLSPSQHRDIALFLSTNREVATIPLINPNIYPIVKSITELYNCSLTVFPSQQTFVLTETKEKTDKARQLKENLRTNQISQDDFHCKFGMFLGYGKENVSSYQQLEEQNINPKTAYLETMNHLIGTSRLSKDDKHFLQLVPYVPAPKDDVILQSVEKGIKTKNQLEQTKLGKSFLQEHTPFTEKTQMIRKNS